MIIKRISVALLAGFMSLVAMMTGLTAQAHHNFHHSLAVASSSVSSYITFGDTVASSFRHYRGTISRCCYPQLDVYVGPGHDVMMTAREFPTLNHRLAATGWHRVPDLAGGGTPAVHLTFRSVNNGAP